MTPTNDQLNRLAAELLGRNDIPDFCTDRNALPQLWATVEAAGKRADYLNCLQMEVWAQTGVTWDSRTDAEWGAATAESRTVTIAALKALSAWPDDWQEE